MDYYCPSVAERAALDKDNPDELWMDWGGQAQRALAVFNEGTTLAMEAIKKGAPKCLAFLLRHGADLDARDDDGWGLMFMAVIHRKNDCLRVLLQHGAEPNSCIPAGVRYGSSPLVFEAARQGFDDILATLAEFGASLDVRNPLGRGPLDIAAFFGQIACVEVLMARDPNWLLRAASAMEQARSNGRFECAAFILARQELAALEASTPCNKTQSGISRI